MSRLILLTSAITVVLLAGQADVFGATASPPSSGQCTPIRAAVQKMIAAQRVPGVAYIVVDRGAILCQAAVGKKNLATQTSVDLDTRFEIGSITKQFTAAAILQLKEADKLSLDDRLAKYLPTYTRAKNVTIRQLLWHMSGVPEFLAVGDYMHTVTTRPGTFGATIALVENLPLDFKPGTMYEYSSTNYEILGRIVEIASGNDWAEYIRAHLFARAEMAHSTFIEDESITPDMATGYYTPKTSVLRSPSSGHWFWAAGSIVSTVGDMAKWNNALFGDHVISKDDLRLMTKPGPIYLNGWNSYGFGLDIDEYLSQRRISHHGGTLGFVALDEFFPKFGETIAVLENNADGDPDPIANLIFDTLHPDVVEKASHPAAGEDPRISARAEEWLHRFEVGDIDRSQLDPQFNKGLTSDQLAQLKSTWEVLGTPTSFVYHGKKFHAGQTAYMYFATFKRAPRSKVIIVLDAHDKIAGWLVQTE